MEAEDGLGGGGLQGGGEGGEGDLVGVDGRHVDGVGDRGGDCNSGGSWELPLCEHALLRPIGTSFPLLGLKANFFKVSFGLL